MTTYSDPRRTPAYRRTRAAFLAAERARHGRYAPCTLCTHLVDLDLPGNVDNGPSVDHITPVSIAPHLVNSTDNLRLAHLICNKRRGTGVYVDGQLSRVRPAEVSDSRHPAYAFRDEVEHHEDCTCSPGLAVSHCW